MWVEVRSIFYFLFVSFRLLFGSLLARIRCIYVHIYIVASRGDWACYNTRGVAACMRIYDNVLLCSVDLLVLVFFV